MDEAELQRSKSESEPIREFAVDQEVKVLRAVRDAEGNRTGEKVLEGGWKVVAVEDYKGGDKIVTTQLVDEADESVATKRYLASELSGIQTIPDEIDEDTRPAEPTEPHEAEAPEITASKNILALENEIDDASAFMEQEAVEHGAEHLSFEDAKKIGEPPVEAVIEDPAEEDEPSENEPAVETAEIEAEKQDRLLQIKSIFERQSFDIRADTASQLRHASAALGEHEASFTASERSILGGITEGVSRMQAMVRRADDYPSASMRTELLNTANNLHRVRQAALQLGAEGTIGDIHRYLAKIDTTMTEQAGFAEQTDYNFEQTSRETDPEVEISQDVLVGPKLKVATEHIGDLSGIASALRAAEEQNSTMSMQLSRFAQELTAISSQPTIDTDEISRVLQRINAIVNDGAVGSAYKKAQRELENLVGTLHTVVREIDPSA